MAEILNLSNTSKCCSTNRMNAYRTINQYASCQYFVCIKTVKKKCIKTILHIQCKKRAWKNINMKWLWPHSKLQKNLTDSKFAGCFSTVSHIMHLWKKKHLRTIHNNIVLFGNLHSVEISKWKKRLVLNQDEDRARKIFSQRTRSIYKEHQYKIIKWINTESLNISWLSKLRTSNI